jgi:hypothetical protein
MIDAFFLLYPRRRFVCHGRILSDGVGQSKNAG